MPKSKRNKIVDLSQARKHGKELKERLFDEIRSCVDNYSNVFVFSVTDMRNSKMKSVRHQWKHSRFFIGKNKVMALAFGRGPEDEYRTNLHKIGNSLKGQCGILFSNKSKDEVISWFSSYSEGDFARSGSLATENVLLNEGPLLHFSHSLEPYFRTLGLPTTLKKGVIHLVKDHEVCKIGDKLTPETARILKLLGYEMAEFHIEVKCAWSSDGKFENLKRGSADKESDNEDNKKQDIINAVISDAKSILSSPDEKSPVFRSLRSRTIKIRKTKKCT